MSGSQLRSGLVLVLFFFIFPFTIPKSALAQSSSPAYWRYDAPGRLNLVEVVDIDLDGIGEFIVIAGDTNLVLIGSDGLPRWSEPFSVPDPILHIASGDIFTGENKTEEIIVATEREIILLDNDGSVIWRKPLRGKPAALSTISTIDDNLTSILLALDSGQLLRFNNQGELVWEYLFNDEPADQAIPNLAVADINRDGQSEIVFSYLTNPGFSRLVLLDDRGQPIWERSTSGNIYYLTIVEFDQEGPLEIAVATSLDRVYLYTVDGERRWPYRSLNKPITSLETVQLERGPALVVGTSVGTVVAYDQQGRRYWGGPFNLTPDSPVLAISPATKKRPANQPASLAVLLGQQPDSTNPSNVILLDSDGRRLEPSYPAADLSGLSQLVDINNDGKSELLLADFATLELLDPGIGVRQYSDAWDYRLGAEPQIVLVAEIDNDTEEELLIGTNDGKVHALDNDGTLLWVVELGGVVTHLALAESDSETQPDIVAVQNSLALGEEGFESLEGHIVVLRPDGREIWRTTLPTTVSSVLVGDINSSGRPELVIGTTNGQLLAYSLLGDEFWRVAVNASVDHLLLTEGIRGPEIVVGSGANKVDRYSNKGTFIGSIGEYLNDITDLRRLTPEGSDTPLLSVAVEDGTVRALSTQGVQRWERMLEGLPSITLPAGNSLLVGTDEQELIKFDLDGNVLWSREDLGLITSMFWGDLDGDVQPDLAIGNRQGEVRLITDDAATTWGLLNLASEVFHVSALRRAPELQAELVAVTDNGVVQLFESQANRPPLLFEPQTEVGEGQYSIGVSVIDVENDSVAVNLEIWNSGFQQWTALGEKIAASGNDTLFWPVDPPEDATEVRYRFLYNDGSHQGRVEPAPGPPAIAADRVFGSILGIAFFIIVGGVGAFFFIRQTRSPAAQVRRLYQRIRQQPDATLELIEDEYIQLHGTSEFLLNLANQARKDQNRLVAGLADGLYLLSAQPESSLPLILDALESAEKIEPKWRGNEHWKKIYKTGQALLTAPTITELSLLRPQLDQLLTPDKKTKSPSEAYEGLLPVATTLSDSERVDLAEDRLVYLREAVGMLKQMQRRSIKWPVQIENDLVEAIIYRWSGLVSAEVEDLQGRAQLVANLLTKHLVPDKRVVVALEIENAGRAPAENVTIQLVADPAYGEISPAQVIPFLSPGRNRQVHFTIAPKVTDRFRIVFTITYNDRHNEDKVIAFADMVHLLPPVQSFKPILNPYSPGMPLRRKSSVFFGRENLFNFVSQNGGSLSQRNVLILVGQRRTGKTSALLQLDEHLPEDLFPVYIDCQSLGVIPGMAALFHDLAWAISESLATKGFEVPVPQPSEWQEDPAGRFQRRFIPEVRGLLPKGTIILLIFDEFEAFENLVNDGILPSTLFTYLRHLMQHGEGLSFIFGGTHRLEEMGTDYWSVLFNIALYRHIGYLSREAAQRLIRDPVAPKIVYDDLAIDKILRVTAGHPYFLQLVCYSIVNSANARRNGYVTISDVNTALEDMLRLGEVHFAYLWQRSTQTEKALLAAASRLLEPDAPFRPEELVQFLAQYSIFLDPAEVTAGLNRLVEREIMREITDESTSLYELRIGLVGLWVAQNKSLSRLYETRDSMTLIDQIMTPGGSD